MSRFRIVPVTILALLLIGSAVALASPGSLLRETPLPASESINSIALANNSLCPCGSPAHDNETAHDDIGTDPGDAGNGDTDNGDTGNGDTDNGNTSDDNIDDVCNHPNRCIACDDCIDCGNDPCPDCCDDGHRCGECCCEHCGHACDTCGSCLECGDACIDCCGDGRRCGDCNCDYCGGYCRAAPVRGNISIYINDDLLRIGSRLSFTTNTNPSGYLIQWRADGKNIYGANSVIYTVRPFDVDKKLTVVLIAPCCGEEVESLPTDYVPYTINLVKGNYVPMGTDDVFFGIPGIVTAYAASKNDGFIDISYELYESGLDSDTLTFSLNSISDISSAGSEILRYDVLPADAANGVIDIIVEFYHRGILITPDGSHAFSDLDCGYSFGDYITLTITQLGNAPTGPITIKIIGEDCGAFYLCTYNISGIDVMESITIDIGVRSGNVPMGYNYNTYNTNVNVSGNYINVYNAPVSVKVAHIYSALAYRGGFHDQYCIGCNLNKSDLCDYSAWSVSAGTHMRSCSVCLGVDNHAPDYGVWGAWNQGTADHHHRTRICRHSGCTIINFGNENHNDLLFPATWTNTDAVNHSRARSCSVCNRFMRTETQAHTWGNWGAWTQGDANNHYRTGSCTAAGCGRAAVVGSTAGTFEEHTWTLTSSNIRQDGLCHIFTCTTCNASLSKDHNFDLSYNLRTFYRIQDGCAFRAGACTFTFDGITCGFLPRFTFDVGTPIRADSGVSPHLWTNWTQASGGTRRCLNCGLQQWRPVGNSQPNGEGHVCSGSGGNYSVIRVRTADFSVSPPVFAFRCVTVCSTCTRERTSVPSSCHGSDPDCGPHNATARIDFRLEMLST